MSAPRVKLGLLGASGRSGREVMRLIEGEFAGRAECVAAPKRGESLAPLLEADAVIDFSSPDAVVAFAAECGSSNRPLPALVIASTGWKLDQRSPLEALAARTPILMASNFSTGVLALLHVLRQASPMLEKLGYVPTIVETHHRHKKDAPSGTALSLQRAIAPAGPGNVQTHAVRAGETVGDHEVTFHGPGDQLTFGHFAQDRSIFARGAIEAAIWLAARRAQAKGTGPGKILGVEQFFQERYL